MPDGGFFYSSFVIVVEVEFMFMLVVNMKVVVVNILYCVKMA